MPKNQNAMDAAKPSQNENFIYRVIVDLVIGVLAVFLLRGVQKYYSYMQYMDTIKTAAGWIAVLGLLLGVAGLVAAAVSGKKGFVWAGSLLLLLSLSAGSIFLYYTNGVSMAFALVIGACLLYVLGQIYANEYSVLTGICGLAGVAFYAVSKFGTSSSMFNVYTIPAAATLLVVLALGILLTAAASRNEGRLRLGKWELLLWQSKNAQLLLYVACVLCAALLILSFILGATFAWYCVWVMCAAIFALTVWFTIKLM